MKKLYLSFVLLLFGLLAQAQSISVKSFTPLPMDMTASSLEGKRIDQNNEVCALIRIVTSETGFVFEAGALGIVDSQQRTGEIWVWVPRASRKLTIMHQQLGVLRDYRYPVEIQAERTYEMVLETDTRPGPHVQVREQYLVFQISPPNATLEVDETPWNVGTDGTAMKPVVFGTYKYRVQAQGYHSEVGIAIVDNPEKPKIVPIVLIPDSPEAQSSSQQVLNISAEDVLPGVFSVSPTQKVRFSKGNLQYQASTNTWQFAEHQWDMIGKANKNISSSYSGRIDLFGWGTGNNPTMSSESNGNYSNFIDWGSKMGIGWRTLTKEEWEYVFDKRNTSSGIRYAKAKVNGINGLILLPDNWSDSTYPLRKTNKRHANYSSNTISASEWSGTFEPAGAIFLSAAGRRYGTTVYLPGSDGSYWSASSRGSDLAYSVYIGGGDFGAAVPSNCYEGGSVRLVCPAED